MNSNKYKKVTDPELLKQLESEDDEQNLLQKFIRYGIKDPTAGLLNMAKEFGNIPHKIFPFLPAQPEINWGEELGIENPNAADKLIQFGAQYAPSFAIPGVGLGRAGQAISSIPKIGKYAAKAVSEAIPQGLYSASQAPKENVKSGAETASVVAPFSILSELIKSPNLKIRTIAKTISGLGAAYIGREGAKALGSGETGADIASFAGLALGSRGFGTTKELRRKLTEGVSPEIANPRLQAAQRLGLSYLTPAEAGLNQFAAKRQGALGRTEEGTKLIFERGLERQQSEREAIERTLNMIYSPGKMDKQIEESYSKLKPVNLPTEFPVQFKDNEVIKAAEKKLRTEPAYRESLKKLLPENVKLEEGQAEVLPTSLVYWDHVKRVLDDMVETAKSNRKSNQARIISDERANLRNQMDEIYPEYAEARALYERKKVRQGLEKVFDQKQITGSNFYRALASEKKFDELLSHLKNAPEAVQNLKDMRLLFKDLIGLPTIKTVKGAEERGMFQERNSGNYLETLLEHAFTRGKNDKAAIEFITSKDWAKQMQELNKISDKQLKLAALSMMLSRGVAQYAGESD